VVASKGLSEAPTQVCPRTVTRPSCYVVIDDEALGPELGCTSV
jgi:hypothetical protein